MQALATLLILGALLLFIVGMVSPTKVSLTRKKSALFAFMILVLGSSIMPKQANPVATAESKSAQTINNEKTSGATEAATTPTNWSYSQDEDTMRKSTDYFASTVSLNTVNFDFPYKGGSTVKINLRKSVQFGFDIIFEISKGQFLCGYNDCSVNVKFDDSPIYKMAVTRSDDGTPKVLFVSDKQSKAFLAKLKTSKTLTLELPFFQSGNQQFNFAVQGLSWEH